MELLVLFLSVLVASISCNPIEPILRQSQEAGDLGEYAYSYESGLERKVESRSPDGNTRGMYSYIDSDGKVQVVTYTAGVDGFHAETSSLPVEGAHLAPAHIPSHHGHHHHHHSLTGVLGDTPEVIAARRQHEAAHAAALAVLPKIPQQTGHGPIHHGFSHHSGPVLNHIDETGILGDTPEVLAAKRQHAAAHSAIRKVLPVSSHGPVIHHGSTIFPAHHHVHNDGIPRFAEDVPRSELGETPEVEAARKAHLAVHSQVKAGLPDSGSSRRFSF